MRKLAGGSGLAGLFFSFGSDSASVAVFSISFGLLVLIYRDVAVIVLAQA